METLELKSGEKIKVLKGACMAEIKDNLPVLSSRSEERKWRCCVILDAVE